MQNPSDSQPGGSRASEEGLAELRLVVEAMAAPVTRCSRDLRYLWASKAYAAWLRRPAEEIVGQRIVDVIGAEALAALRPHIDRVLAGERVEYEERIEFAGLGPRWIHAIYTPTTGPDGTIDGWIATVIDVDTSRRQTSLLADIFAADPGALALLVGQQLRFAVANPAYRALLPPGVDPIGRPYASVWADDLVSEREERLRRALFGRDPIRVDREERVCGDGRRRVFTSQACRISWDDQPAVLSVLWETTALEDARRQIERYVSRLHELQEEREDLFRMVSHDLRSPLMAIVLHAQLLAREAGASPGISRRADSIHANAKRMESLISEMAELVRIESSGAALDSVAVDAAAMLRALLLRLGESVAVDRVRVSGAAPHARADPSALERVLVNLLTNALKYSPEPEPVLIEFEDRGETVAIRVTDRGPGIAPEHRTRIFERFYRVASDARPEGLGLGLYITRTLLERMGGHIAVDSAPDRGTTFTVTLPSAAVPSQPPDLR